MLAAGCQKSGVVDGCVCLLSIACTAGLHILVVHAYLNPAHPRPCNCRVHLQLEFEVSGPTVAGEGEVKVLGRLARPRDANAVTPDDTHSKTKNSLQLGALDLIWHCSGSPPS